MKMDMEAIFADRKKLAVAAAVFGLAVFLDAAFGIGGQIRGVAALRQKVAKKKAEIEAVSRDMALMKQAPGSARSVKICGEHDIPGLLKYISSVASAHGIRILQLTPLKSRDARALPGQAYLGLTVKLELTGGYHDFGLFINELRRGEHPLFAEEFRMAQGEDFNRQRISLSLKTYVKK